MHDVVEPAARGEFADIRFDAAERVFGSVDEVHLGDDHRDVADAERHRR